MSTSESQLRTICPSCNGQNDQDMTFCLQCGHNLRSKVPVTVGNMCPRCGRFDQLNAHFCVFCGADTTRSITDSNEFRKFSWELDRPDIVSVARLAAPGSKVSRAQIVVVAAVMALIGVTLGVFSWPLLRRLYVETVWPDQSLVMYTSTPGASVIIEPAKQPKLFTVGKTGPTGSLVVPDIPPGTYIVRLGGGDYYTSILGLQQPIKIEATSPTTLGYGEKLKLKSREPNPAQ